MMPTPQIARLFWFRIVAMQTNKQKQITSFKIFCSIYIWFTTLTLKSIDNKPVSCDSVFDMNKQFLNYSYSYIIIEHSFVRNMWNWSYHECKKNPSSCTDEHGHWTQLATVRFLETTNNGLHNTIYPNPTSLKKKKMV